MKKILSFLLAVIMMFSTLVLTNAKETTKTQTPAGYLTMSIEASTLGLGFIEEPTKVPFYKGESVAKVFDRFLNDCGIDYTKTGTVESGFYLGDIQTKWLDAEIESKMEIPQYLLDNFSDGKTKDDYIAMGSNGDGSLGQFCYSTSSGWVVASAVCKGMTPVGVSDWDAVDGDTIRWQFTLEGFGADLCYKSSWGEEPPFIQSDKDELFAIIGAVNTDAKAKAKLQASNNYDDIIKVATTVDVSQAKVNSTIKTIYDVTGVSYDYIAKEGTDKTTVPVKGETSVVKKPLKPTDVKAVAQSTEVIKVTWNKVAEADGYEVYRFVNGKSVYYKSFDENETSFNNAGKKPNTTYYYKMRSYKVVDGKKLYSGFTDLVTCTTPKSNTEVKKPLKPTNVKAVAESTEVIKVTWNKVSEADGYEVYRFVNGKSVYYKSFDENETSFNNAGKKPNTTYYYKMRSYKVIDGKKLYSGFTDLVTCTTPKK